MMAPQRHPHSNTWSTWRCTLQEEGFCIVIEVWTLICRDYSRMYVRAQCCHRVFVNERAEARKWEKKKIGQWRQNQCQELRGFDCLLLSALKMEREEGARSQGMWAVSKKRKRQENEFVEPLERNAELLTPLILAQWNPFITSNLHCCKYACMSICVCIYKMNTCTSWYISVINMYAYAIKFVVICYTSRSSRKLTGVITSLGLLTCWMLRCKYGFCN